MVFVTAFTSRDTMRSFLSHISWETEVWIAEAPDHLIHFNGERFLGPYPDVMPSPDIIDTTLTRRGLNEFRAGNHLVGR